MGYTTPLHYQTAVTLLRFSTMYSLLWVCCKLTICCRPTTRCNNKMNPLSASRCGSLGWGVRGQPHGFSVSTRLYSLRLPSRAASPPCCTLRHQSTFSLPSPAPLSTKVCLQDSLDTILFFSQLYMPKQSQPGLPCLVRDAATPRMRQMSSFLFLSLKVRQHMEACGVWSMGTMQATDLHQLVT